MFRLHSLTEWDFYRKVPKTVIIRVINFLIEIYLSIQIKAIYMDPIVYTLPIGAVIIRQSKKGDLMSFSNIFNLGFTYLSGDENKRYVNAIKKNRGKYPTTNIVAEYNKRCIGFITTKPELNLNRHHIEISLHITWMAVDPRYRGHRISVKLSEYLIQIAKKMQKIDKIITQTNISNIPAIKAYKNVGFEETEIIPNFINDESGIRLEYIMK